jgi:formate hydrogenlyase transcriptional activator
VISYELARAARHESENGSVEDDGFAALNSLTRPLGVADRCNATLAAMESLFDARPSWVLLREPKGRRLRLAASRGCGTVADCSAMTVPDDQGLMGRALSRREMLFIPSIHDEADWPAAGPVRTAGLRRAVRVPLVVEDTAGGVLARGSPRFSPDHPPTSVDIARLEAAATLAAVCIENARLFEDSERDRRRLREALQQRRQLRRQVAVLRQHATRGARRQLLGSSAALEQLLTEIEVVARAESTVLLRGETGTGKELAARAIHERSPRRAGPFVAVNCAALPEALVESQLFGHERGAFTGAVSDRAGKFELADGGTLFLDEVGDLPADAQSTLLRVLEDRRVERVGSTRSREVDVRVVAATNVDLEGLVDGRFRPDLYYRLSVFPVQLPALRDRRADIPLLATHFAQQCAEQVDRTFEGFMPDALDRLVQHDWPGTVRELRNVVERAVLLTTGAVIEATAIQIVALPPSGSRTLETSGSRTLERRVSASSDSGSGDEHIDAPASRSRRSTLAETDREAIEQALHEAGWRVSGASGAARLLGLKPTTLHSKMKRLGIRRPTARRSPGPVGDA